MAVPNQLLLTRAEVAKVTSLCERTIYTLTKKGVLPSVQIGKAVRYRTADIEKFARTGASTK